MVGACLVWTQSYVGACWVKTFGGLMLYNRGKIHFQMSQSVITHCVSFTVKLQMEPACSPKTDVWPSAAAEIPQLYEKLLPVVFRMYTVMLLRQKLNFERSHVNLIRYKCKVMESQKCITYCVVHRNIFLFFPHHWATGWKAICISKTQHTKTLFFEPA